MPPVAGKAGGGGAKENIRNGFTGDVKTNKDSDIRGCDKII